MVKRMLLGDEAIALGAIHAGLSGVYAYPGTPSTEITEFIQRNDIAVRRGLHSRWSVNEKTAMEEALGMSFMGKRALVCMKHVGLNVCADPFVNSGMTGVNGGVVVLVADDPSMHSSQDEQDSRFYGKFAMIPTFEPSDQQEAYDMMAVAFDYSEQQRLPVLMRVTTRIAHSRAVVEVREEARKENTLNYNAEASDWVLLPANARRRNEKVINQQATLERDVEKATIIQGQGTRDKEQKNANHHSPKLGIIACGIAYNYVMESFSSLSGRLEGGIPYPLLKISRYPLPRRLVRELVDNCEKVLIAEEGQPFVEDMVRGISDSHKILGRMDGTLPRTGELTPDSVKKAIFEGQGATSKEQENNNNPSSNVVVPRPPALCRGCGHRDVYAALNEVLKEYENARVFGDIGCYTLGFLPPYRAIHSCVDMGASITMAKGAADAGQWPAVAVIGDSTFTHSGMTGLLDAINENADITVIISDNLTTGMTGGQDSAGTNKYEAICRGLGISDDHIHVVVPLPKNMPQITETIRNEINYHGTSVIIPRRECMQTLQRHLKEKKK